MADDVPAPDAPAANGQEPTPVVPASPQEDTPTGAPGVTNSSRAARPLPAEIRWEFFTGQAPAVAQPAGPELPPAREVPPPPARPDLDDEDMEFKLQLTIISRSGELGCRSVTVPCPGGKSARNAGAVLQARESLASQTQSLMRLMLDKLRLEMPKVQQPEALAMAPGPSAIALMPEPSGDDAEGEELVPRT